MGEKDEVTSLVTNKIDYYIRKEQEIDKLVLPFASKIGEGEIKFSKQHREAVRAVIDLLNAEAIAMGVPTNKLCIGSKDFVRVKGLVKKAIREQVDEMEEPVDEGAIEVR